MNELALFAGIGGGALGTQLLGASLRVAVENDPYAREVLLQRQRDGCFEHLFPIWSDVRTFDGRPWRGHIDLVSGGFPCQDISSANRRACGVKGARSGLWSSMARIVGEVQPGLVFVENSPMLARRGLDVVLSDLARLGFDAEWCVLGASDLGAPHARKRLWLLAAHPDRGCERTLAQHAEVGRTPEHDGTGGARGWPCAIPAPRVDARSSHRLDRTRATGNAQVPVVAAAAFARLAARLQT